MPKHVFFTKNQASNKSFLAAQLLMLEEDASFVNAFQAMRRLSRKDNSAVMVYGYKLKGKNGKDELLSTNGEKVTSSKLFSTLMSDKCSNHVARLYFPVYGDKRTHWYMLKCTRIDEGTCAFEFEHTSSITVGQVLKETKDLDKPLNILNVDN